MNTRIDYVCPYDTNEHGIITSPGKFEGEMYYVPYYYDLWLQGSYDRDYTEDNILYTVFILSIEDCKLFPELCDDYILEVWQTEQGFVTCEVYTVNCELPAALKDCL